jgi:proteasome lid subunit RPN8/RPN11
VRSVYAAPEIVDAIVRHARAALPRECCGVLIGRDDRILDAIPVENIADGDSRFELDPKGHIEARRRARAIGTEVLGFYHSHPRAPAVPSERDRAEAAYDGSLHAIVSLAGLPAVGLFEWVSGDFAPVGLAIDRSREHPAEA